MHLSHRTEAAQALWLHEWKEKLVIGAILIARFQPLGHIREDLDCFFDPTSFEVEQAEKNRHIRMASKGR